MATTPTSNGRGPRPRAARRQPLLRTDIVSAAIVAYENGQLDEMSMRGLAGSLDVTPMALYAHVVDKDEILDEVLDHVLGLQPLPTESDWRAWMTSFALQLHATLCAHPVLLNRFLRRPVGVPAALTRMDAALGVLSAAGFPDEECIDIFASLHTCTVGFSALEVSRGSLPSGSDRTRLSLSTQEPGFWPAYFSTLPASEFPNVSRMRPDLGQFASAERFVHVVDGLLAGRAPQSASPRRRATQEVTP